MSIQRIQVILAGLVLLIGLAIAFSTLSRGIWLDEFITHMTAARGLSPQQFLDAMSVEQHPLLHYGLIYIAQAVGITDYAALRALNVLGVVLVLLALRVALRRRAVTASAACIIVALYASSPIFLGYFAELRAYFLLFSASLAVSLAWLVMLQYEPGNDSRGGGLAFYGLSLAALVNLHYFGTIFGALLTLALLADLALRKDWRRCGAVALVALVAAAPAAIIGAIQARETLAPGNMDHITTSFSVGLADAMSLIKDASAKNLFAVACAVVALLFFAERWRAWTKFDRHVLLLGATTVCFLALVLSINIIRPIVEIRYLFACAGGIVLLISLLCTGPGLPSGATIAICLFALATQANAIRQHLYHTDGWRTTAMAIADQVEACPTTRVYAAVMVDHSRTEHSTHVWREGYGYYARKFHFTFQEAHRGDVIAAGGLCPSLIWMDHAWKNQNLPVDVLLKDELQITAAGRAEARVVGSGVIITIR